ncbi:hypothetical protein QAD02_013319 [Eretmocerus hayati]|uniref:Uncharacterized protein n=1 Tax=Eretmocerus hayati TaxID=131215 RepID=A0ACC2P518_9HYME|nr:hypothetical protein QAD02_013319 [Eretmocerus hayati]
MLGATIDIALPLWNYGSCQCLASLHFVVEEAQDFLIKIKFYRSVINSTWIDLKKAERNFKECGNFSPLRSQRGERKRKKKSSSSIMGEDLDEFLVEEPDEPPNKKSKESKNNQPLDKVTWTEQDRELAAEILCTNEDSQDINVPQDVSIATISVEKEYETPNHREYVDRTQEFNEDVSTTASALPSEPPTLTSDDDAIDLLLVKNQKLVKKLGRRDNKIMKLVQAIDETKAKLDALEKSKDPPPAVLAPRVSPPGRRDDGRALSEPPKEVMNRTRRQAYPLPTDGYELPPYCINNSKYDDPESFAKWIMPILFTDEQLRKCSLYGIQMA